MDKKYFVNNVAGKEGPFDLEELKSMQIPGDTLVLPHGSPQWVRAAKIPELEGYVSNALKPDPVGKKVMPSSSLRPKSSNRKLKRRKVLLNWFITILGIGILFLAIIYLFG